VLFAVAWVLELDALALDAIVAGKPVSRLVSREPRTPIVTPRPTSLDDHRSARQNSPDLIRPLLLPPASRSHLFEYQREGASWLRERSTAILADDMGLGKTIQCLTALREIVREGDVRQALIICPRSLLANWEAELARWAPELRCVRVTPAASIRDEAWKQLVGKAHVLLTNYEQLRAPPPALIGERLGLVIADEAQWLRNLGAALTRGVTSLTYGRFWALTGTPIERHTEDLASLIAIMDPQRFSPEDARLPSAVLRARARPYVLRRHKDQVLADLPDVLESRERLELLPAQRATYHRKLREVRPSGQSDGDTLRLLSELRQICDFDPATKTGVKIERSTELLSQIRRNGEKAVVFSVYLEPLHLLHQRLTQAGVPSLTLTGDLDSSERDETIAGFTTQSDVTALLASVRVAGVGLTRTAANHVLFLNQWWNPSTNSQARDRVIRIGQDKRVHVYTYCCRNTVEEALERILAEKSAIYEGVVDRLAESDLPLGAQLPLIRDLARETLRLAGDPDPAITSREAT